MSPFTILYGVTSQQLILILSVTRKKRDAQRNILIGSAKMNPSVCNVLYVALELSDNKKEVRKMWGG
jgi:hypothetical protein